MSDALFELGKGKAGDTTAGGVTPPASLVVAPLIGFEVRGIPESQGSMTAYSVPGGRAHVTDSNKRLKPWRQAVIAAAAETATGLGHTGPYEGPVTATIAFSLPKPESAPKRRRTFPKKLDVDKGARAVLDALVNAGVIYDDNRVIELHVTKRYVGDVEGLPYPGAHIQLDRVIV